MHKAVNLAEASAEGFASGAVASLSNRYPQGWEARSSPDLVKM